MTPASPAQNALEASAELTSNHERALLRKGEQLRESVQILQRRDHRFFLTMAILAAITVFLGFFPTYFQKPLEPLLPIPPSPKLATLLLIHGAVMTAYILFYVLQTAMAGTGRRALHMTLGWASVVFIPAISILGTMAVIQSAKLGHKQIWPDLETNAIINIFDVPVFAILATAAILLRAMPETHKRLMLLALIAGILPAAIARSPAVRLGPAGVGAVIIAFLLAGPFYDLLTRRRIHRAYVWGLLFAVCTMPPTRLAIAHTQAWHRFVDWVIR
jgi:hypothetical protein